MLEPLVADEVMDFFPDIPALSSSSEVSTVLLYTGASSLSSLSSSSSPIVTAFSMSAGDFFCLEPVLNMVSMFTWKDPLLDPLCDGFPDAFETDSRDASAASSSGSNDFSASIHEEKKFLLSSAKLQTNAHNTDILTVDKIVKSGEQSFSSSEMCQVKVTIYGINLEPLKCQHLHEFISNEVAIQNSDMYARNTTA